MDNAELIRRQLRGENIEEILKVEETTEEKEGSQETQTEGSTQTTDNEGATPNETATETPPQTEGATQQTEQTVLTNDADNSNSQTTEVPYEVTEDDVLKFFIEKKGMSNVQSIEDLTKVEQPTLDEELQAIYEFKKTTNKGADDYFKLKQLDESQFTDEQFAKYALKAQAPHLSDSQINFLYENKYVKDADVEAEEVVQMAEIELANEVAKGKALISEAKNHIKTPLEDVRQTQQAEIDKANELWMSGVNNAVSQYTSPEKVVLDDEITIDYSYNEQQKEIMSSFSDLSTIGKHFANEQTGQFDHSKLVGVIAKGLSADEKVAIAYKQGIEKGKLVMINKQNNVVTPSKDGNQETPPTPAMTNAEAIKAQLKAQGRRYI